MANSQSITQPNIYFDAFELTKVDDMSKFTIFGYIRNAENVLSNELFSIIPKNIYLIILAFYVDLLDAFNSNLCNKDITISNDNKNITNNNKSDKILKTCYGKKIISSMKNGTYIWKIKILNIDGHAYIGIDNANAQFIESNFSFSN